MDGEVTKLLDAKANHLRPAPWTANNFERYYAEVTKLLETEVTKLLDAEVAKLLDGEETKLLDPKG